MTNTKTVELVFKTAAGKNFTISLDAPREGLTGADVSPVMETIISKNIFATTGGDVVEATNARIINKEVVELELL